MPRDTPPSTVRKPQPQIPQPTIRAKTPPRAPKQVLDQPPKKDPEPALAKQGPSETIEEAFLRAGATVIEAAPVLRDFQKEAVKFVPSVVKKRPPPSTKKVLKNEEKEEEEGQKGRDTVEGGKGEMRVEKSFVTTVEDEVDETSHVQQTGPAEKSSISEEPSLAETVPSRPVVIEPSLKRPLETEMKVDAQPPAAAAAAVAAPPKRRRMVNAAPDV